MKYFFTLFIVLTLQLCLIQAREVEEQHVEDRLIEDEENLDDSDLGADYHDSDLEEDFGDSNAVELRARPSKRPLCMRTKRTGWGGKCLFPAELKNQSCDFIWGGDDSVPVKKGFEQTCRNEELYCCVNCKVDKQEKNCVDKYGATPTITWVGRDCPEGEYPIGPLDSGCMCCGGKCKRTTFCKRNKGYCVYKYGDETNDYASCEARGWRLKTRGCEGKTCACCIE